MEMEIANKCKKMNLPNGKVVDILSSIFEKTRSYIQDTNCKTEAGGYIVGYQHSQTGNITLEDVSVPYSLDVRNRVRFSIRDPRHKLYLMRKKCCKSFYMGVWHTHPQTTPIPSSIDWSDWNETVEVDRTGAEYIFFVILGTSEIRVWVGDINTKKIVEIFECEKKDGIYS